MLRNRPARNAISLTELLVTVAVIGTVLALTTAMFVAATDFVSSLQGQVNAAKRFVLRRDRPQRSTSHLIPDQYVVLLGPGANPYVELRRLSASIPLEVLYIYNDAVKGFAVRVPPAFLNALVNDPAVQFIEQDQTLTLAQVSSGMRTPATGIRRLNLWQSPLIPTDVDADIAIIDTGVNQHPELNVVERHGFGYANADDLDGHGTQVAGIAAAKDRRVGVAPGARIWALKVLQGDQTGSASNIVNALNFVASRAGEIDVVNISVSTTTRSAAINAAAARCVQAGVVVVAAAGNGGSDVSAVSPASEPGVITVAAFADSDGMPGALGFKTSLGDEDDSFARSFSNYGPLVDFVAPGVDIATLDEGSLRTHVSGTSFAAPHVAGLAALLLDRNVPLGRTSPGAGSSPDQVRALLAQLSTEAFPGPGRANPYPLVAVPKHSGGPTVLLAANTPPSSPKDEAPALAPILDNAPASGDSPWQLLNEMPPPRNNSAQSYILPKEYQAFKLDYALLRDLLKKAPLEFTPPARQNPLQLALPTPDGGFARFNIVESPIMAPGLAAQFPEIKTYSGQGIDDPTATLRMDISPFGFHVQVLSPKGAFYIDPFYHLEDNPLISYYRKDLKSPVRLPPCCNGQNSSWDTRNPCCADAAHKPPGTGRSCVERNPFAKPKAKDPNAGTLVLQRTGPTLRSYRTAVAATAEYTAFHGGTVAAGQAAIVTAMNRVTGIYEIEFTIRFTLVPNNNLLVYTNAATDPYTNSNPGNILLSQNQTNIDSVIGSANYDIGHVFSTASGGVAGLGVVGVAGQKARGTTGITNPIGDPFYVDYVAHEIGHQFDAEHTFNVTDPNRVGSHAYEPGSGSTIMGYAGLFGPANDLQSNSDPYFHSKSFDDVIAFVTSGPGFTSATLSSTGNTQPTVNAGADYTIPAATPFVLTASATDVNGDSITYCWEERDLGPSQPLLSSPDNGSSPLFRSWNPTASPKRYFPRLPDLLAGTINPGEKLPTLARTMNFRVTARDNRAGGGGVNTDDMVVTVINTGAPFQVTSPNTAVTWAALSSQTVTWNVAGTSGGAVNTPNVNILLSTDGGTTFPTVLAANTPNDGSEAITVPNVASGTVRVMVEGAGNIFFDVSNVNFTITTATPGITIAGAPAVTEGSPLVSSYTVRLNSAPSGNVTVTLNPGTQVSVLPSTLTFTPINWNTPQTVNVTAIDDAVFEGPHTQVITHTATSSDASYNGLTANVTANITDNDVAAVPGIIITGTPAVTEGSAVPSTYTVRLNSAPTANVTVNINPGTQVTVTPPSLTFTTANWNTPQTVSVLAVDDAVFEGPHSQTIIHTATSADASYNSLAANVNATITDNDVAAVPGIVITGTPAVTEGSAVPSTYTVRLNSAPTANVTVNINPGTQVTVTPPSLTFTTANWNTPQTVSVLAVDDAVVEGPHSQTIIHTATSADASYNSLAANVNATITDNDVAAVPGIIITGTPAVTEGSAVPSTYTVRLNSAPTANVTVNINPGTQVTVTPPSLTFTTANWNTPQTVSVLAVDDAVVEGPHSQTIIHTTTSADASYNSLAANVNATITDNDVAAVPGIIITGTPAVTEGSAVPSTYTVRLNSAPTANVTVNINPGTQVTVTPPSLTFTTANWNTPQTVSVLAVDDAVFEGPHTQTIIHTAASGDVSYNGLTGNVTANITDNDPPPPPLPIAAADVGDSSDKATGIGTLTGAQTLTGMDTFRHADGRFDDDWYAWTMSKNGDFTVDLKNIGVVASGPKGQFKFGDLHFRIYRVSAGNLIELASSQSSGVKTLTVSAAQNERILVWVYGLYFTQATYDLSVNLK